MIWLCPACFLLRHDDCDPLTYFCSCPCGTGEVLDPYRIPDLGEDPDG